MVTDMADPFVIGALFVPVNLRCPMHVHGTVSPSLLENLEEYQKIWSTCLPEKYASIEIAADQEMEATPGSDTAIACFSGGVDAIFTVHQHVHDLVKRQKKRIRTGLFVHGFDMPLSAKEPFRLAAEKNRLILESVGVDLVTVATNFRTLGLLWNETHGAALASCLHLFKKNYSYGLIGSSGSYRKFTFPWGSTPLGDPLLSSRDFQIIHDGSGYTRSEKLKHIADWQTAVDHLRVCWEGNDPGKNCGTCEKCIRTILNFWALGYATPRCFERDITLSEISYLAGLKPGQIRQLEEVLDLAIQNGRESEFWVHALKRCLQKNRGVFRHLHRLIFFLRTRGFGPTISRIRKAL